LGPAFRRAFSTRTGEASAAALKKCPRLRSVGPFHVNEPEVGLVNQCGGLKRLPWLLLAGRARQLSQLIVNQRQKLLGCRGIALGDFVKMRVISVIASIIAAFRFRLKS
jgi:hypothetical protein